MAVQDSTWQALIRSILSDQLSLSQANDKLKFAGHSLHSVGCKALGKVLIYPKESSKNHALGLRVAIIFWEEVESWLSQ